MKFVKKEPANTTDGCSECKRRTKAKRAGSRRWFAGSCVCVSFAAKICDAIIVKSQSR